MRFQLPWILYLGLSNPPPSQDAIVANKGLGWDPQAYKNRMILVLTIASSTEGQPKLYLSFFGFFWVAETNGFVLLSFHKAGWFCSFGKSLNFMIVEWKYVCEKKSKHAKTWYIKSILNRTLMIWHWCSGFQVALSISLDVHLQKRACFFLLVFCWGGRFSVFTWAGFVKIHVKRVLPHQMVPRSRSELPKLQDFCSCCSHAIDHRRMDLKTGWVEGVVGWVAYGWFFWEEMGFGMYHDVLFLSAYGVVLFTYQRNMNYGKEDDIFELMFYIEISPIYRTISNMCI